jgi:hypothetical protein
MIYQSTVGTYLFVRIFFSMTKQMTRLDPDIDSVKSVTNWASQIQIRDSYLRIRGSGFVIPYIFMDPEH